MRHGSPASPAGARRADDEAARGCERREHRAILPGKGGDARGSAVGDVAERGADVVLARVVGRQVGGRGPRARSIGVGRAEQRGDQRLRKTMPPTSAETGLPGRPSTRHAGRAGRTSAACRGAWRPSRNRAPCRPARAPLRTRSWSPTEAPPSVTTTSAGRADGAVDDGGNGAGVVARRCRGRAARRRCDRHQGGEADGIGGDDLVRAGVLAGRHQLVAGGDEGDARPTAHRQRGIAHGGGERELAHAEPRSGGEEHVALAEIEPGPADVPAAADRLRGRGSCRSTARRPPGSGSRRRRRAPARR